MYSTIWSGSHQVFGSWNLNLMPCLGAGPFECVRGLVGPSRPKLVRQRRSLSACTSAVANRKTAHPYSTSQILRGRTESCWHTCWSCLAPLSIGFWLVIRSCSRAAPNCLVRLAQPPGYSTHARGSRDDVRESGWVGAGSSDPPGSLPTGATRSSERPTHRTVPQTMEPASSGSPHRSTQRVHHERCPVDRRSLDEIGLVYYSASGHARYVW